MENQNVGVNQSATNLSGLVCNVHRTTGREPHALVGATTTILGDKLYVFGGRLHSRTKPQLTSDLYELDLIRRHWTKLETIGDIPPPRYFHSVCSLGDTKLVCYGGMSPARNGISPKGNDPQPEVVVMSDIHVYDITTNKWTLIPIPGAENPQGRYAHCATIIPSSGVFTSADAPLSAIHHNPSSSDPHSGTIGVQLDGTGGAEMIVVGGQDSANNYIEQINVFNLRSLKWTQTSEYEHKCGAYKSMVAALPNLNAEMMGKGLPVVSQVGTSMLIYSNYNFLDVKLELQIRLPDGTLIERPMTGQVSPPGLRFPNGGIINDHFVVSGTYLTSSKHEYALWALDLKTLSWGRIDTAGTIFGQGSWNRGVLWNRRNTFIILGNRKRNLVDDYNHRRINFSHLCMVELEAFGLYDNPRRSNPNSAYKSMSAPAIPVSLQSNLPTNNSGGRTLSTIAEQLGQTVLGLGEFCDMELVAMGGEIIPCNSNILSRRWGPYFHRLFDSTTIRPPLTSRTSTITITNGDSRSALPASRPRSLYLPHMASTIKLLLHYLYTSSLPPSNNPLCSAHTLCSLLQMARPYQIDGLLEATIERLHEVLDGRNAAAVFNAAAMAAGGGIRIGGTLAELERRESQTTVPSRRRGKTDSMGSLSSTSGISQADTESSNQGPSSLQPNPRQVWTGDVSSVIGLQKRGLRGLMEGRRLRERAATME